MFKNRLRMLGVAVVATAGILAPTVASTAAVADRHPGADPAVIAEWNEIADRTIFTENQTPVPSSSLYFGFVSIAMYDAVVAIEGRYEPYLKQRRVQQHASSEVAAATAAFTVLRYYFPNSADELRASYLASFEGVRRDAASVHGVRVGLRAAGALIAERRNDGIGVAKPFTEEPAPGVWRPTPPSLTEFAVPWLGFVEPLTYDSPADFPLPGPPEMTSEKYAQEFVEVRDFGESEGSSRTPEQTATALFFNFNVVSQLQAGLRDEVTRRGYDIVESARAFALMGTSLADTLISCWHSKYEYGFWRPVTAIELADTDGNPATDPEPGWTPLAPVTPPYPDYVSGHACNVGAASHTLSYLFGAETLDLNLVGGAVTRHYDSAAQLDEDTMNARIWLGLHFRSAMTDGNELGHRVSNWVIENYFQPVN
ncbi:vanadium-dependent haloperoxidase [Mycetocola zhadangensis]|uniref:Phosphatase PAP2 family protein n=1 Tax=Mycetocola zhadangensis TaxID=1164595 RepID=A0A3L7JC03_9MICO|nr:vanadium-dependent haloperoxidase [Mycetocola zhadangensis]RLQ86022.1 hypothetical protein D9V28_04045 [Mycetocola zhadangensis]GGE87711.1 hypothetical protein GCM10011313_07930 [Mycetocola zhadangensis]